MTFWIRRALPAAAVAAAITFVAWPRSESREVSREVTRAAQTVPGGRAEKAWSAAAQRLVRREAPAIEAPPSTREELIGRLAVETDERALFRVARALQRQQSPQTVVRTVEALRTLPPPQLAVGLHAILGRREPEAVAFASDVFLKHPDPIVQAKAAFVLSEVVDRAPAAVMKRAVENVREPRTPSALKVESLDLLGSRPMAAEEQQAVAVAFEQSLEPEVRNAALRAAANGGADPEQVRLMFEAVAADPSMPAEMREAARQVAESLAGRRGS